MKNSANSMPNKLLHDTKSMLLSMLAYSSANFLKAHTMFAGCYAPKHAFFSNLHKSFTSFVNFSTKECFRGISMKTIQVDSDIDVNYVSIL